LVNIKTGEILRLDASFEQLTEIVVDLLRAKFVQEPLKSDEDWAADCDAYIKTFAQSEETAH